MVALSVDSGNFDARDIDIEDAMTVSLASAHGPLAACTAFAEPKLPHLDLA